MLARDLREALKVLFRIEDGHEEVKADMYYRICVSFVIISLLTYIGGIIGFIVYAVQGPISSLSLYIADVYALPIASFALIFGFIGSTLMALGFEQVDPRKLKIGLPIVILGVVLNLFLVVYLQMRGNAITALPENEDAEKFRFSYPTLGKTVEFAMESPEEWKEIQDELNCCGLSLYAAFADTELGVDNFDIDKLHNGRRCLNDPTAINSIKQFVLDDTPENARDSEGATAGASFFCEEEIAPIVRQSAQSASVFFGITTFLLLVVAFLAPRLLYSYMEKEGGFKPNYDKYIGARPVVEQTILDKAGYKPKGEAKATLKF